jgi:ParB-like chromosome segregation protein Spo0J
MIEIPSIEKELLIKLKMDETNPNIMTKEQIQSVANSIKKYGFLIPIIVNKDNIIIDGHQRKNAAELLGMDEVPVIRLNVDKVDAKLLKQIMNKLKGQHDYELDLEEYKVILQEQGNLDSLKDLVSMSDDYIDNILREISPKGTYTEEELDDVPEVEGIKTDIKYGDIFGLGAYIMVNGKKEYIEIIEE